ncbi:MAG: PIN domain-containing protein [Candidatus Omnitrophica bacterium]|nr:PIN domain-containing protein [Candidatus Omnitrophota bacterium]MBU0879056.1 PIN domain-containing protein [Candidatus Omnitrophota bacterium]MBU0896952.1 PIN domain-containing protein [Candidatus Omnitrophota bacterium]MBU1133388.1 PIN domain-containing protein [Candidatus Omnitrophota bacterium]MBU1366781.1 PIN domain-containing protein [Candidatus Omnitrophota bacterium]
MQLIVDANILVAAFLKAATTRELLFDEEIELFAPEYFAMEISQTIKKDKILRRYARLTKEENEELLNFLLEPIKIIPEEEYNSFIEKVKQEIPADDAPYLALSLALKIPIWSNDSAFKKQSLATVYTTPELVKILRP